MSDELKLKPVPERREEHHAKPRSAGQRPIKTWVPDIDSPAFEAAAHRQFLAVAKSIDDNEDQTFIDAVTDWSDE